MPAAGVEPAPCCQDWILSPARLPIPSRRQMFNFMYVVQMVLVTGLEPVRYFYRGILSPLRLPISPHQHNTNILIDFLLIVKIYFNIIFIILNFAYFVFYIFIEFNNLKSRYKFRRSDKFLFLIC